MFFGLSFKADQSKLTRVEGRRKREKRAVADWWYKKQKSKSIEIETRGGKLER